MPGKVGKEGKVYSLIGGTEENFRKVPSHFDQLRKAQNIPHSPSFPTALQNSPTGGSQRLDHRYPLINGRILQREVFGKNKCQLPVPVPGRTQSQFTGGI